MALNSCCCCLNLKKGSIAIGILSIVFGLGSIIFIHTVFTFQGERLYFTLVDLLFLFCALTGVLLICGVFMEKTAFLVLWSLYTLFFLVVVVLFGGLVAYLFFIFRGDTLVIVLFLSELATYCAVMLYFVFVVMSLRQQVRDSRLVAERSRALMNVFTFNSASAVAV